MRNAVIVSLILVIAACAPPPKRHAPTAAANRPTAVDTSPAPADLTAAEAAMPAGLGFYPVTAPGVPAPVAATADSIFILKVLAFDGEDSIRQVDVSNGQGRAEKARVQALDPKVADDMDKLVVIKQIEACERYPDVENQKTCVISGSIHTGSGFVAGDGKTLWTNAHVVENSLKYLEYIRKTPVADQLKDHGRVAIFVFDAHRRLVVDPNVDAIFLKVIPAMTATAAETKTFYAQDSDYAAVSLSRPIATPLKIAARGVGPTERLFVLGYPLCTGCTPADVVIEDPNDFVSRAPRPNSDGQGLKVTSGVTITAEERGEFFGQAVNAENFNLRRMLFSTADSQHGNSGGPVMNARGEVIAIHAGGLSKLVEGQMRRVSRAVIPTQFR